MRTRLSQLGLFSYPWCPHQNHIDQYEDWRIAGSIHVSTQKYPNMLVTAGYYDSQVQYFEPAKWVAKLRALKTDHNTILFTTFMHAGHGGNSGRLRQYDEYAIQYASILDLLVIRE